MSKYDLQWPILTVKPVFLVFDFIGPCVTVGFVLDVLNKVLANFFVLLTVAQNEWVKVTETGFPVTLL